MLRRTNVKIVLLEQKPLAMFSRFGWKPDGEYLLGIANTLCASELTLENKNIKEGEVTFSYKLTDPLALAYFTIRNERCVLDGGRSHILPPSSKSNWASFSTSVPTGSSTLQWYLYSENYYDKSSAVTQFKLKSVKITGRPAAIACIECEPGYYADKSGSDKCHKCPENMISERRASSCSPCADGMFSLPGSSECSEKEVCKPSEYITTFTECSATRDMQHLVTKLIEPVICEGTKDLVPVGTNVTCASCPLGTKVLNTTHCGNCPSGFLTSSDGRSCKPCPDNEVPIFGIRYDTWSRMPPRMTSYCHEADAVCQVWQLNRSSIFVGPGLGSYIYSVLELDLNDGFLGPRPYESTYLSRFSSPLPDTKLIFEFELDCQGPCSLTFIVDMLWISLIVGKWTGRVNRTTFSYEPYSCEGVLFTWEFKRWATVGSELDPNTRGDKAIIYSIEVNNTRDSGALGCKKCPLGIDNQFCKPCNEGLFYTMITNKTSGESHAECVPCPNGTMVIGDASAVMTVEQACKACPPGTIPGSGDECLLDLRPVTSTGQRYDFRKLLNSGFTTEGAKLFTSQGYEFQHHFNLFLNTHKSELRSNCINSNQYDNNVTSWICRETWSPVKDESGAETYYRSRALSLGDVLARAVQTNSSDEFAKEINSKLVIGGWKVDDTRTDYHLFFRTKSSTSACPDGISTIVTLRCGEIDGASNTSARVQIPPNCAVGTCDGCQYHFMMISPLACPICRMEDYHRIAGGCFGGVMEVTLLPPKTCRPAANFTTLITEPCPLLSLQGKIAVGLTMALIILLLLTIFYCYRRNKKLEYKYMKLVEGAEARVKNSFGSSSSEANQQGTECGIPEDEKELELNPNQHIKTIAGGERDNKWNQLALSTSGDNRGASFGPVIFRSRTADDSHILTLDDGNEPI
ncbi:Endosome/lysosome-associated apoptosi and autophagy regulator family member 2 [Taenia solium]|eukprot:TsM_000909500 transcript=TsM_000909500 gene=TsM_000909500